MTCTYHGPNFSGKMPEDHPYQKNFTANSVSQWLADIEIRKTTKQILEYRFEINKAIITVDPDVHDDHGILTVGFWPES